MIRLRNSNISGENANVYKKILYIKFQKHIISSKTFGKGYSDKIENEKNRCKEKKAVIFSANSYHILLAPFLL